MEQGTAVRLENVMGYANRTNDLLHCTPIIPNTPSTSTVVYFGGDMQDFAENMQEHRDGRNYTQWSLESTALLLREGFPNAHIVVVRPSRIEYKTFSCFKNFVPCSDYGVPEHDPSHKGLQHLEKLLQAISKPSPSAVTLEKTTVTLIGFSKGCVVLNQFLHEFHAGTPPIKIDAMYWLDGGHSGGKNTWITQRDILQSFANLGINIYIHVTPYQIGDERRPWIRKEEKRFGDILRSLGAPVLRVVHFPDDPPTLQMHFNVLNMFLNTYPSSKVS